MRAYFLDRPLTDSEIEFVEEALETSVEQIRIPFILPVTNAKEGYKDRPLIDDNLTSKNLLNAGILRDKDKQVALVMPLDMHWYAAFTFVIEKMTGSFPYLIQTAEHRESIGNKGGIRIIDMERLVGDDE